MRPTIVTSLMVTTRLLLAGVCANAAELQLSASPRHEPSAAWRSPLDRRSRERSACLRISPDLPPPGPHLPAPPVALSWHPRSPSCCAHVRSTHPHQRLARAPREVRVS